MEVILVTQTDREKPDDDDVHAVVSLVGELDMATVPQLTQTLDKLAQKQVRHVTLDLAELTFTDSSGLQAFVNERDRIQSLGGELVVLNPSEDVRRVFEVTGLEDVFNICAGERLQWWWS